MPRFSVDLVSLGQGADRARREVDALVGLVPQLAAVADGAPATGDGNCAGRYTEFVHQWTEELSAGTFAVTRYAVDLTEANSEYASTESAIAGGLADDVNWGAP